MLQNELPQIVHAKASGDSYSAAGRKLGMTKDKAQKIAKKAQVPTLEAHLPALPASPQAETEITFEGDNIMLSDLHVMAVQPHLVEKAREAGQYYGIKQASIVGDLFNFDIFSLYPQLVAAEAMNSEIVAARTVLVYLMQWFDTVYFCRGNHDTRLMNAVQGQVNMQMIGDLILREEDGAGLRARLVASQHDRLWLRAKNDMWLLCHQREYAPQTLVVANRLAMKYSCNVVTAHQHHFGVGQSKYGGYIIADNPCMCDPTRIAYTAYSTNSMPDWAFGFSVIKDGSYIPYVEGMPVGIKL